MKPVPLTSEEVRQQAQAERLPLLRAKSKTGYFGVHLTHPGKPKPYQAQVSRGGKKVYLGCFATAEEAALCVARSPEGQAAAQSAAAAPVRLTSEEARQQAELHLLQLQQEDWLGVVAPAPALGVSRSAGGILERGWRRHLKAQGQGLARPRRSRK